MKKPVTPEHLERFAADHAKKQQTTAQERKRALWVATGVLILSFVIIIAGVFITHVDPDILWVASGVGVIVFGSLLALGASTVWAGEFFKKPEDTGTTLIRVQKTILEEEFNVKFCKQNVLNDFSTPRKYIVEDEDGKYTNMTLTFTDTEMTAEPKKDTPKSASSTETE